jgi:hypothetical protein
MMDVLRGKAYDPRPIIPIRLAAALDDVELLEAILSSEMCVFLLDQQVSYADVLLAMAHAHCVPSIRLQYDPTAERVGAAAETGRIRWANSGDVLPAFRDQVDSYRMGLVRAISSQDVRKIGTTQRTPRPEQLWDPNDYPALMNHINPATPLIRDFSMKSAGVPSGFVNADPLEVCTLLYGS